MLPVPSRAILQTLLSSLPSSPLIQRPGPRVLPGPSCLLRSGRGLHRAPRLRPSERQPWRGDAGGPLHGASPPTAGDASGSSKRGFPRACSSAVPVPAAGGGEAKPSRAHASPRSGCLFQLGMCRAVTWTFHCTFFCSAKSNPTWQEPGGSRRNARRSGAPSAKAWLGQGRRVGSCAPHSAPHSPAALCPGLVTKVPVPGEAIGAGAAPSCVCAESPGAGAGCGSPVGESCGAQRDLC